MKTIPMQAGSASMRGRLAQVLWGAAWKSWQQRLLGGMLLLVAAGLLIATVVYALRLYSQVEVVRREVVQREFEMNAALVRKAPRLSAITPTQADAMNEVIDRLNVPWGHILDDLEALTPEDVALLQIEPRVAMHALQWQVEAKSRKALFAYLDKLNAAVILKQVRLLKMETNTQDPNRPMRFLLEARVAVKSELQPGKTNGADALSGAARMSEVRP